ncbi:uncharacterized protein VTP21DRAFT_9722 [Calcarisporiella thermophila]|uniref:uncharacterized protein n=1 Tax=Calcarisporiella thermophila TaxID=911321 RepID=UPI003742052C
MATSSQPQQPEWHQPKVTVESPRLKLFNSLTRSKNEFQPAKGKQVTWYNCGPTVYDASHMGHARTYLTMDIIRRILQSYFGYDVFMVMNITDIDDKIILRARQNHLFQKLKSTTTVLSEDIINRIETAWVEFARSKLPLPPGCEWQLSHWKSFQERMDANDRAEAKSAALTEPKFPMYFTALKTSFEALSAAKDALSKGDRSKEIVDTLLENSRDVISPLLDKEEGATVTDPKIFRDTAAYWENEFMKDMEALNVQPVDVLTRVSEYVPEIVTYIEKIIANGYAYEAEGSIYFDTTAFDAKPEHHYAKLEPWSRGNMSLIEEGEGSLGSKLQGKKNASDFALWKKSKPGEPAWPSPWGAGRPGWHIECSVMASEVLGSNLDIHSGGSDLAFPHHDNELAQSEAYHGCPQWVNYFLHAGHLHIEGQKMSKSLKNFISIREALKKYSSRQIRMLFLMYQWNARLDFGDSSMTETISVETALNNFFTNVKAIVAEHRSQGLHVLSEGSHQYRKDEKGLMDTLLEKQRLVHLALCDNLNTPAVISEIMDLVSTTNVYLKRGRRELNVPVVEKVARWITSLMKTFGLADEGATIGWGNVGENGVGNTEELVLPYARALSAFRDNVRKIAIAKGDHKELLALSDRLRDVDCVELGVLLDDQEDGKALVKLVPKEELLQAREQKLALEAQRAAKALAQQQERERKRIEKLEKGRVPPEQMFRERTDEFSKFDEQGLPTHDAEGQEITKSRSKKLLKEWTAQRKLHEEFLAWQVQEQKTSSN